MKKKPVTQIQPKRKLPSKSQEFVIPSLDEMEDPPEELDAYRILIYGRKAIGKTSLLSQFPGVAIGMLERHRKGLKIRKLDLKDWDDCRRFRDACLKDDSVRTVGFDTFDVLYELAVNYECAARGISHPSQMNDYGATWAAIRTDVTEFFDPISEEGKGLVVLSHEKKETVEVRHGEPYDQYIPSCPGGAFKILQESWEICLHYSYYNKQRALSVRPMSDANMEVWCSTNVENTFMDPKGEPISIFTVPNTPKGAYEELDAAFHNQVWDAVRGRPGKKKPPRRR